MSTDLKQSISDVFRDGTPIDHALETAARAALVRHKQCAQPMPVWRDGKTIMISPEELEERLNLQADKVPEEPMTSDQ